MRIGFLLTKHIIIEFITRDIIEDFKKKYYFIYNHRNMEITENFSCDSIINKLKNLKE